MYPNTKTYKCPKCRTDTSQTRMSTNGVSYSVDVSCKINSNPYK